MWSHLILSLHNVFHAQLTWKDELPKRMLVSLALNDIEAKLTEENITAETFSSFAARYVSKCDPVLLAAS